MTPNTSATGDHVVSRAFFLIQKRSNLLKVPACDVCNEAKSRLEHYPRHRVSAGGLHASKQQGDVLSDSLTEVSMGSGPAIASISMGTKTIQKVKIRILPFVFLLFVVALLDRVNIGFAALTMNRELAITSQQYGLIFGIFFGWLKRVISPVWPCT